MVKNHSRVVHRSPRTRARRYAVAATSLLGLGIALAAPGDLDLDFNSSGLFALKVGIGGYVGNAEEVVQQSDNKLVLAGWGVVQNDHGADFIAIRISQTGTLDSSFGTEGVASADFDGDDDDDVALSAIAQPDGKLILAGLASVSSTAYDIGLARFDVDGSLDSTFGTDGLVTLDLGGDSEFVTSLALQSDGRVVTAAGTNSGGFKRCTVVRFNANGSLDTTFGVDGSAPIDFGGVECAPSDLKRQSDGKLVLVASVGGATTRDFAVARLTAGGTLDASFDGDGLLVVDFDGNDDAVGSIAIQADDAIVAAGYSVDSAKRSFNPALVRINGNGSLDDGFGSAGRAIVDLGNASALYAIVAQADGTLVATGFRRRTEEIDSPGDLILARFSSDGALDTSFGIDGVATADFGSGSESFDSRGYSLIQQSDGKLVATGSGADYGSFIAARFADDSKFSGRVGLSVTSQSVDEAAGKATFVVRRTGGKSGAISVHYATEPGSAQPGSDFDHDESTLTWSDGDTEDKIVVVNLIDDERSEHPEDFSLKLSAPSGGAQLAASHATTTITDGDGPGELALTTGLYEPDVSEDVGTITVYATRRYGSTGPISVRFSTASGSATASDFVPTSGELTWSDGDKTAKKIEVQIIDDSVDESVERFEVRLSSPTGGATVTTSRLSVFIYDNDPGSGGGSGTLELVTTASTVSEGGTAVLTVVRDGAAVGAASVDFTTASGSATAGSDFTSTTGTLNWADGDAADKTIVIFTTNDTTDESDETFTVTLSNPSGGATLGSNSTATVTIADDDAPGGGGGGGILALATVAATVSEGGTAVLTVVRDGAAVGAASVDFATASGSATAGSDFTSTTGTLNWADGDSASKTIAINTTNDTTDEGVETFTVTLSSSVGATLGPNTTATITITDDDPSGDSGGGSNNGNGDGGGGGKSDGLVLLGLLLLDLVRKRTMSAEPSAWQTRRSPRCQIAGTYLRRFFTSVRAVEPDDAHCGAFEGRTH